MQPPSEFSANPHFLAQFAAIVGSDGFKALEVIGANHDQPVYWRLYHDKIGFRTLDIDSYVDPQTPQVLPDSDEVTWETYDRLSSPRHKRLVTLQLLINQAHTALFAGVEENT